MPQPLCNRISTRWIAIRYEVLKKFQCCVGKHEALVSCNSLQLPIGAIGAGSFQHQACYLPAQIQTYFVIGSEMNAALKPRFGGFCSFLQKEILFCWKEVAKQRGRHSCHGSMSGRVTGKIRCTHEYRPIRGVVLIGPGAPISILGIPAGNEAIVNSNAP